MITVRALDYDIVDFMRENSLPSCILVLADDDHLVLYLRPGEGVEPFFISKCPDGDIIYPWEGLAEFLDTCSIRGETLEVYTDFEMKFKVEITKTIEI